MTDQAKTAPQLEAEGIETVDINIEIRGTKLKLTFPKSIDDSPIEVGEAFELGHNFRAFMLMAGPAQAAKIRAAGATMRDFSEIIIPAWNEATGLGEAS